jgi:hypothetical protein
VNLRAEVEVQRTRDPRQSEFERTQSALNNGIEACRSVLRNYRRLIADESGGVPAHRSADNDQRDSANDRN